MSQILVRGSSFKLEILGVRVEMVALIVSAVRFLLREAISEEFSQLHFGNERGRRGTMLSSPIVERILLCHQRLMRFRAG